MSAIGNEMFCRQRIATIINNAIHSSTAHLFYYAFRRPPSANDGAAARKMPRMDRKTCQHKFRPGNRFPHVPRFREVVFFLPLHTPHPSVPFTVPSLKKYLHLVTVNHRKNVMAPGKLLQTFQIMQIRQLNDLKQHGK